MEAAEGMSETTETYRPTDIDVRKQILNDIISALKEQALPGIKEHYDILLPVTTMANLFDITERRIQQLMSTEKILPREVRGKYLFLSCIMNLVRHQRRLIERNGGNDTLEDLRKVGQQLENELKKIEIEKTLGNLVSVDEVKKSAMNEGKKIRDAVNNIIPRVRALLAAETDELKCGDILQEEFDRITKILEEKKD